MRYFCDVEFNGFGGELISIGLAPEDRSMPPFYEAVGCAAPTPWVRDHVMPRLDTIPLPRDDVAERFAAYLADDPKPVIVADWPEDIAHAARLLTDNRSHRLILHGVRFELLPAGGFASEMLSAVPHNAYHDAVGLRDWVMTVEAEQRV
ncbi:MAG: hypothetical protein ABW184_09560 [Sphingobium sp.]